MPHGGVRSGAGRPRNRERFARPIARAEKTIADRLPLLLERLFSLADGVMVQDVNPESGEVRVFQEKPDRIALEYLINRILGKPTERKELSGEDGGPIPFVVEAIDYRIAIAALAPADAAPGPMADRAAPGEGEGAGDGATLG